MIKMYNDIEKAFSALLSGLLKKRRNFPHTIIYVTGPAKINHVSANYTELYFSNIFSSEYGMQCPLISEESPLNSAVVTEIFIVFVQTVRK